MRLALIGLGAIGNAVGALLARDAGRWAQPIPVLVRNPKQRTDGPLLPVQAIEDLLIGRPDVVIEAAGVSALEEFAVRVLQGGADLMCLSVAAFGDKAFADRAIDAALAARRRILVPSGAIGALDALTALAAGAVEAVTVEQWKTPEALGLSLEQVTSLGGAPVFEGSARDAVRRFPRTSNVTAAVALAGVGFDRTQVRVLARPDSSAARVVLRANGEYGSFTFELENVASANARTSAITAASVVSALERQRSRVVIPA